MCVLRPHTKKGNKEMPIMFALQLPGDACPGGNMARASRVGKAGHVQRRNVWQGLAFLLTPAGRGKLDFGFTQAWF